MVKAKQVPTKSKSGQAGVKSRSRKPPANSKSDQVAAEPTKAVRLTFAYDGAAVKLVSQQRVEMAVPPSDPVKGFGKRKGFWAELRSKQDETLYRQVIHNPTRNDAEVFPVEGEQSISREPAPKRKGFFVVVVPDTDKGDTLTMCRSPLDKKGPARGVRALASKPATQFRRFKLKK